MKKTIMLAVLAATAFGSTAMAAETAPTTAPKTTAPAATSTTHPNPMVMAIVVDHIQPGDHLTSKVVGANVYSTAGDKIGDVNDLILDRNGKISGIVVGVGGFLGVGEKNVALSWDAVTVGVDEKGKPHLSVHVTKDALEKATPFTPTTKS